MKENASPIRITHKDIAQQLGVHRTTVSMALRGHPSIPQETRDRVAQVAADMGYAPDPMLTALSAYRSSRRPAAYQGVLAWVVNSADGYKWSSSKMYQDYHTGAIACARKHGFTMETIDLGAPGTSPASIARTLRARSMSGLLLCPQPRARMAIDFPWSDFSAITFGYTLEQPSLHTIVPAQYRNATRVMREFLRRGYRRIGLVFHDTHDARTDHNNLGAYLAERHFLTGHIKPLLYENHLDYRAELKAWLQKWRPDAIISGLTDIIDQLQTLAVNVPGDVAVACPGLGTPDSKVAGVYEESLHVGEVAVDFLVAMMQRGERGVPAHPQRIHVEGSWVEASTLRPLS